MAGTPPPESRSSRKPLIFGAIALVLIVVVGFGAWYLFIREDAPDELSISDSDTGSGEVVDVADLDGTWSVVAGSGDEATVAGYRVPEVFGGTREITAYGRTSDVTGEVTVAGGEVTEAAFTVDMTTLESDEGRRDNAIRSRGLETDSFPEGTFQLTEPVALPEVRDGKAFTVDATGDLTLHGVTQSVTIELDAKRTGDEFVIQGSAPIEMADYEIEPPSVGGFVEVEDAGTFEFLLTLAAA